MALKNRRFSGMRANINGDEFENLFESFCRKYNIACEHLPPSGAQFVKPGIYKPLKICFDFICSYQGQAAFLDTKSLNASTFPKSLVKGHQVLAMQKFSELGHPCGYVIELKELQKIYFFSIETILDLKQRDSLKESNSTVCLGTRWNMDPRKIWSPVVKIDHSDAT